MAETPDQYSLLIEPVIYRLQDGDTSNAANQVILDASHVDASNSELDVWNNQVPATQQTANWLPLYKRAAKVLETFPVRRIE
jgi:hypothetical protein